ncbi:hypothetical protein ACIBCA_36805 [Kitasatospora sp. NPDC051170]|uniref:hypothetical protein n=1 Tax=Kitasatospora sp. NPDC051170 TaxID=3364056 RepID=UPI003789595F
MTQRDIPGGAVAVPDVAPGRYPAPLVTAVPVVGVISPAPTTGRSTPGHYQHVLLDTATGELAFHESTEHLEPWNPSWRAVNDVPRETWKRWHPGTSFSFRGPHMWFQPVPEVLSWTIDSGVKELPYLDAAAANALLEELTPFAQALLNGLFEAGGELDWSADSARAGRNIGRLCSRHRQAAGPEVDADLVDYAEIVQRFPQVYQPGLLGRSLDKLAEECEYITRYLGFNERWHPEIKKVYGTPASDGTCVILDVLGVRAWYRTLVLDGDPRPVRDFADWDAEHGRLASGEIASTTTDDELAGWAEREELRAGQAGLRLLGTLEAAGAHRSRLREQDWDRLAVVGADVARLERELGEARTARLELVNGAIGWGRADAAIAERARMTRQAVYKIRTKTGDET